MDAPVEDKNVDKQPKKDRKKPEENKRPKR